MGFACMEGRMLHDARSVEKNAQDAQEALSCWRGILVGFPISLMLWACLIALLAYLL